MRGRRHGSDDFSGKTAEVKPDGGHLQFVLRPTTEQGRQRLQCAYRQLAVGLSHGRAVSPDEEGRRYRQGAAYVGPDLPPKTEVASDMSGLKRCNRQSAGGVAIRP